MTSVRVRALAVGGALVLAAAMTARIDVARAGGGIKGDEATFVGLAASAGYDGDLTYGPADYQRFRRWYGSGPEGIFLKRGSDGEIYFGKAYLYGLLAAPFARVGGLSGLLIFNLGLLALVIAAGYAWLRPMSRAAAALAFSAAFVAASVAPLYAFWLTADVLNFALVFLAFAAAVPAPGARPRSLPLRLLGFVLLAGAIFSKPLNLPLALALAMGAGSGRRTSPVGALAGIGAMVAVLFAVNAAWTGELNYQGGERKTFYGSFPYDESGQTFETSGIGMTTNTVQTPVGAEGRASSVVANLWYFVTGRHFGLVPFGWPWLVAVVWWLVGERRKMAWQWALMAGAAAAAVGTIVWMPYTWSGGGGPVGNRYFLSVAAALFFLVPRPQSVMPGAVAALGLLFVAPSLASPFVVAKQPWRATATPFFDILPLELTGASDFPVILDQRRGRIPQGRAPTVFVALLDERSGLGRNGWIAVDPGVATSLLVRSPERLDGVTIGVKSTSACDVGLASGGARERAALGPNDRRDLELSPPQTFSRDSFVFVLTVDSTACDTPIEVALQARTRRPGDADGVGRAGRHSRFVRDVGLASGIAVLR